MCGRQRETMSFRAAINPMRNHTVWLRLETSKPDPENRRVRLQTRAKLRWGEKAVNSQL
jgi:hypothetical protein